MERGVIAGGVLVTASFLLAVLLNHVAVKESAPMSGSRTRAADPAIEVPVAPALDAPVGTASAGSSSDPGCCKAGDESCPDPKSKEAQGGKPPCDSP